MKVNIKKIIKLLFLIITTFSLNYINAQDSWDEKNISDIRKAYLAVEDGRFGDAMNLIYSIEFDIDEQEKKRLIHDDRVVYNLTKALIADYNQNIEDAFKYVNRAKTAQGQLAELRRIPSELEAKNIPNRIAQLSQQWSAPFKAVVMPKIEEAYDNVKDCTVHHAVMDYLQYVEGCVGIHESFSEEKADALFKQHFGSSDIIIYYLGRATSQKCIAEEYFFQSQNLWEENLRQARDITLKAKTEFGRLNNPEAKAFLQKKGITPYIFNHLLQRIEEQLSIVDISEVPADTLLEWKKIQEQQVFENQVVEELEITQERVFEAKKSQDIASIRQNILFQLKQDSVKRYQKRITEMPKMVRDIFDEVVRVDPRISLPCSRIEAIPKGEYGQDIAIQLTYGGCDSIKFQGKDYGIGKYRTDGVDIVLLALGKTILYALGAHTANKLEGKIKGYADGNPIRPTELDYDGEIGRIFSTRYYSNNINDYRKSAELNPSAFILNTEELAFLRAYYAKHILARETGANPNNFAIESFTSMDKGEDFRKVEIELYIKDAHLRELSELSDQLKEIIRNKTRPSYEEVILN